MRYRQEIDLRPKKFIVKEIKYFHPSGLGMPNGHAIQRGGFIRECQLNSEAYGFDESIHPKGDMQQRGCLGGVIVCPADLQFTQGLYGVSSFLKHNRAQIFCRSFWTRLFGKKRDEIVLDYNDFVNEGIFKGHYLNRETGEMYDSHSATFEISGLSSTELLALAKCLLDEWRGHRFGGELLINDLNRHKHYLVCIQAQPQMQISATLDNSVIDNISRHFGQFECAVFRKFPDHIEAMGDGVYSKIREYAESEEYKNAGFVPQMYRREWDRKLYAVTLRLRYAVAKGDNCYVFVNVECKPDFFKNVQKLAKAFNQKSIIVKDAGSQDADRVVGDFDAMRRVPAGRFVENIPLAEILQQSSSPLGKPLNYEDLQQRTYMDTWAGRNNMGKYMISQITQKIMEELGFETSAAKKNA